MLRIHWICSAPAPYNNSFFAFLAQSGEVDLTVHFRVSKSETHPWKRSGPEGFKWECYGDTKMPNRRILSLARNAKDHVFVVGGWNDPTMLAVIAARAALKAPFAIWTDTPRPVGFRNFAKETMRVVALRTVLRAATTTLATGGAAAQQIELIGSDSSKVTVFPYWVPVPAAATPLPIARDASAPISFVSIGRLEAVKRFDIVIKAIRGLVNECGRKVATLTIVGDGRLRHILEALIEKLELRDIVTFAGWQEHHRTLEYIEQADALIHAADWEPYGVVILEAMARGRPVIASQKTMAAVDRVTHLDSGLLFQNEDVPRLVQHLKMIASDPDLLIRMGERARNVAELWPMSRGLNILKSVFNQACGS